MGTKKAKVTKVNELSKIGQLSQGEIEFVLKVADLIEKGSEGMIQVTGHYLDDDGKGCCAMGAAFKGAGLVEFDEDQNKYLVITGSYSLLKTLGAESWPRIAYPQSDIIPFGAGDVETAAVIDVVICLNDRRMWSFKRIVDYLRDATLPRPKVIAIKG